MIQSACIVLLASRRLEGHGFTCSPHSSRPTHILIPFYTIAISNHFTAFQCDEEYSSKRVAFGQRVRRIREDAGVALVRLCQDAHLPLSLAPRLETEWHEVQCGSATRLEAHHGVRRYIEGQQ
jgi:hypothetical protein